MMRCRAIGRSLGHTYGQSQQYLHAAHSIIEFNQIQQSAVSAIVKNDISREIPNMRWLTFTNFNDQIRSLHILLRLALSESILGT